MIKYEEVPALAKSLIVCDVCGKEFDVDSNDLEAQEFLRIEFSWVSKVYNCLIYVLFVWWHQI